MIITPEEREKERALFTEEKAKFPELFVRVPMVDDAATLSAIGITIFGDDRPLGYLKLFHEDFIVEEIGQRGELHSIDPGDSAPNLESEGETCYADLVKLGVSTLEAQAQIAIALGIEEKEISFAGIKDKMAITAQKISIRRADSSQFSLINNAENWFLKNIHRGKGIVANGDLLGNRFTITLRLPAPLEPAEAEALQTQVREVVQSGFWNFFYLQRFGTPRLLNRMLGRYLFRGEYERVIKTVFTHIATRELPYFALIRKKVEAEWGDWKAIEELFAPWPYHFHLERRLLLRLLQNPSDFLGALQAIPDQIRLWFYAYDCFLFNTKLSELIAAGKPVPESLPLATSFRAADWEPYAHLLAADEVRMPMQSYRDFPFVRIASRTWPTRQKVEVHDIAYQGKTAVFCFSLPKGSYATTFLSHFFALASGLPMPEGIESNTLDPRTMLGRGNIETVRDRFKKVIEQRALDLQEAEE